MTVTRTWGTLSSEGLPATNLDREVGTTTRIIWRPASDLELPPAIVLTFDCITGSTVMRRFAPTGGAPVLILNAALVGYAIRKTQQELVEEETKKAHAYRLFYQLAERLQEFFARQFTRRSELYVTGIEIDDPDARDVLPELLGVDELGKGSKWSVEELISRGRDAAELAGIESQCEKTWIRMGLREAAKLNPLMPLRLSENQLLSTIRMGLFDLGSATRIEPELHQRITERLRRALTQQLEGDIDDFNKWFFDGVDNLVHQVAKQKRNGGPVDRKVVRQVLLDNVFESHKSVMDEMSIAMAAFLETPELELSDDERSLFEAIYLPRKIFGGFSLIMLHHRFPVLRETILDVLENPTDERLVGMLVQVLYFYGQMVQKRRAPDRERKRVATHRRYEDSKVRRVNIDPDQLGRT